MRLFVFKGKGKHKGALKENEKDKYMKKAYKTKIRRWTDGMKENKSDRTVDRQADGR